MAITEIPHIPVDSIASHIPSPAVLAPVASVSEFTFSDPRANLPQLELGPVMQRAATTAELAGNIATRAAFLPFVFIGHVADVALRNGSLLPRNSR